MLKLKETLLSARQNGMACLVFSSMIIRQGCELNLDRGFRVERGRVLVRHVNCYKFKVRGYFFRV